MRLNFRVFWFRIELLPTPKIVLDIRRDIGLGGCLVPLAIGTLAIFFLGKHLIAFGPIKQLLSAIKQFLP